MQCPRFDNCRPLELLWSAHVTKLVNGMPKVIHQTWKDDNIPDAWKLSQNQWRILHPTWTYVFWTDSDIKAYIHHMHKDAWDALFEKLQYPIQRVDLFRYFVLHDFGGIYCDMDIVPVYPVDSYLEESQGTIFLVPSANTPSHFTNAFMMSTIAPSARRFWQQVIEHVGKFPLSWSEKAMMSIRHLHIMMSTGPMALTNVARNTLETVSVLPRLRWNPYDLAVAGDLESQDHKDAIVKIVGGSSWHAMDSKAISWLHIYKLPLIVLASLVIVYLLIRGQLFYKKARSLLRFIRRNKQLIEKVKTKTKFNEDGP